MKRSWLVQRLTVRDDGWGDKVGNVFAFGGGLRNGGLSDEAMRLLPFRFDYMGSAEFEFGEVPKALQRIATHQLVAGVTDTDHGSVLYICAADHETEVVERIKGWAAEPYSGNTKEAVNLHQALTGADYCSRLVGWLELDNGFAFFADEDVWRQTCQLFGVELIGGEV